MLPASTRQHLQVPSLRDPDAWGGRAPADLVAVAVTRTISDAGIRMDPDRIAGLSSLVASRGYSPAELAYAAQELPFDTEVDWKKKMGQSMTAADFERVITAHRKLRENLKMRLRLIDVNRLVSEFPNALSVDDFGVCGEAGPGEDLFRFRFKGRAFNPNTAVMPPATREGETGGTYTLHELVADFRDAKPGEAA